jgi:hypothetical protein
MNNIHEKCKGCKRINHNNDCSSYIKPTIWWQEDHKYKKYCPLATHYTTEGEKLEKKRVGQQKQRKKLR